MVLRRTKALTLFALLCTTSHVALAQETQPGDVCTAAEEGFFRRSADDVVDPSITGQHFMFCDGANWIPFLHYDDPTDSVFLRADSGAPGDSVFENSQWTLWLDEGNDQFELKGKKSDGTTISATVGMASSTIWTDNTTYISYNSAHFINSGQTLPAVMDDNGTRLFFYPDKKAFRGGEVTGGNDAWQEANIGATSFAWGSDIQASGAGSVALGAGNTASGYYSIAFIKNSSATANYSIAIGSGVVSSGRSSVAMGENTAASGDYSFAHGYNSIASGTHSVAFGSSTASGDYSFSMGPNGTVASGNNSVAFGEALASGSHSIAGGRSSAGNTYSIALGNTTVANGHTGVALGNRTRASAQTSTAMGSEAHAAGQASVAFGLQSASQTTDPQVSGARTMALFFDGGTVNANSGMNFTSTDKFALIGGEIVLSETQVQGANTGCIRFEPTGNVLEYSDDCVSYTSFASIAAGTGLWTDNTSHISYEADNVHIVDAAQTTLPAALDNDGTRMFFFDYKEAFRGGEISGGDTAWQNANIGTHSFAWGLNAQASGAYSTAIGQNSTASGIASLATGGSTASNSFSVAMGSSTASNTYSIAMGKTSVASGYDTVAMGLSNTASGDRSFAIGSSSTASGDNSVALGKSVTAGGNGSTAFGYDANASGLTSVAVGLQTYSQATDPQVSGDRSFVLFMDGNTGDANSGFNFTSSDKFAVVGGEIVLSETQVQGANTGCLRFNPATDVMEYSDDCSSYTSFASIAAGTGLWTDNLTHISYESDNVHIVDAGQTSLPAVLDDNGTRMFFYDYKEALRGGEISGGNNAWQDGNIGTHSLAWGLNVEASGTKSVAFGLNTTASGANSVAFGDEAEAAGDHAMVFGLQTASQATDPRVTGNRTVAFFFDGNTVNANSAVTASNSDTFIIYGGRVGIGMTNPSVELDITGSIEYTGTLSDVSDRRLKTDIKTLPKGQLENILALEGVTFKMKAHPEGPIEYGFIAQDVDEIYPSLVSEDEEGTMSLNYVGMIAPMAEAIEEQNDLIKTQGALIKALEARIIALEKAQ